MNAYRQAEAPVPDFVVITKHRGPHDKCPVCGALPAYRYPFLQHEQNGGPGRAYACTGAGWWKRLFGGCRRNDMHLHQRCLSCCADFVCEPLEPIT